MDDRGTVAPALVILLAAGVAAVGLAVDLGRFAATSRDVAFAADAGAEAGAAVIDTELAYSGILALDAGPAHAVAVDAALRARPRPGRRVAVEAGPDRVCVTVVQEVDTGLLRVFGVAAWTVSSTGCAAPARG